MRSLYHLPLCPFSRAARLALAEKRLDFHLIEEPVWQARPQFLRLNPAGNLPVLVEDGELCVVSSLAIGEYLEEAYPESGGFTALLPKTAPERAEVRRLVGWFDGKFHDEVTANIVYEKVDKRLMKEGEPFMPYIREGLHNIRAHLGYVAQLLEARSWLAGKSFSLADIAAAAHLSCLDYLGDVPWGMSETVKEWYVRMKSRPSFRTLLQDRLAGMLPPAHYADLDF
jgi:glutathione S-transferase